MALLVHFVTMQVLEQSSDPPTSTTSSLARPVRYINSAPHLADPQPQPRKSRPRLAPIPVLASSAAIQGKGLPN